ncbi:hypothetical protein ABPG72_017777 [Tetrahymena utriculariae]
MIPQVIRASLNMSKGSIAQYFSESEQQFTDPICPICQQNISSIFVSQIELVTFLSCGHFFCFNCIQYYMNNQNLNRDKCPQCRSLIIFFLNALLFFEEITYYKKEQQNNTCRIADKLRAQQALQLLANSPQTVASQRIFNFQIVQVKRLQNLRLIFQNKRCYTQGCSNPCELGCELCRAENLMYCTQCVQGGSQFIQDIYKYNSLITCGCQFIGKALDIIVNQEEVSSKTKEMSMSLTITRELRMIEQQREAERKARYAFYCAHCRIGYDLKADYEKHLVKQHQLYAYKMKLIEFLCFNCFKKGYKKYSCLQTHKSKCTQNFIFIPNIKKLLNLE